MTSVAQAFDAAAHQYDEHAAQQREALEAAVRMAQPYLVSAISVLDAGCGTGYLTRHAATQGLCWEISGIDISEKMCAMSGATQADMRALPHEDAAFDMWFSSLALQWVDTPPAAFSEAARVLKKGGHLVLTCYVQGTLGELAQAFTSLDNAPHILAFHQQDALLAAIRSAGLHVVEAHRSQQQRHYQNLRALLRSIKGVGASAALPRQPQGLMTPRRYAQLERTYEQQNRTPDGLKASWHLLTVIARKES